MTRRFRILCSLLLVLALPLSAWAGAARMLAGLGSVQTAVPACHALMVEPVAADAGLLRHGAAQLDAVALEAAAPTETVGADEAASFSAEKGVGLKLKGPCGGCAACCAALALFSCPAAAPADNAASAIAVHAPSERLPFLTGGPERPPRPPVH